MADASAAVREVSFVPCIFKATIFRKMTKHLCFCVVVVAAAVCAGNMKMVDVSASPMQHAAEH